MTDPCHNCRWNSHACRFRPTRLDALIHERRDVCPYWEPVGLWEGIVRWWRRIWG